jgi:cell division protein FtsB
MRPILLILILVLIGLQYKLWLGDESLLQWQQLEKKIVIQKKENDSIASQNRALEADILELKSGDQALEEQARYELGMIKNDETYYQFVE